MARTEKIGGVRKPAGTDVGGQLADSRRFAETVIARQPDDTVFKGRASRQGRRHRIRMQPGQCFQSSQTVSGKKPAGTQFRENGTGFDRRQLILVAQKNHPGMSGNGIATPQSRMMSKQVL